MCVYLSPDEIFKPVLTKIFYLSLLLPPFLSDHIESQNSVTPASLLWADPTFAIMFHIFAVSRVSYFFFTGNKRLKAISNTSQTLAFSNVVLEEKPRHKHLGIALQNNCKWDEHIRNLSSKVSMLINCLRHFKHKLSRKANETMYYSFILPLFGYADIIWNNCTVVQSTSLETYTLKSWELTLVLSEEQATKTCISSPDSGP